jgi:hypothetical protein
MHGNFAVNLAAKCAKIFVAKSRQNFLKFCRTNFASNLAANWLIPCSARDARVFRRSHGNLPKTWTYEIPWDTIPTEIRRHTITRFSVCHRKHRHTIFRVSPKHEHTAKTHDAPKLRSLQFLHKTRLDERLAPTVNTTPPIAVGCKMGVCREHTGVPRNRRALLSPTSPNEEKLWTYFSSVSSSPKSTSLLPRIRSPFIAQGGWSLQVDRCI